ncbi:WxL domain-containing protein [Candidatus Enterococcus mansonii]|uniref:WxL domain-containing protein n=1 Tax=Candidatus Enterococcus mansonii TaxID=1834181 RepID=A0A242CFF3_9ENTE|nr:WxL domain-containing protein [Enterococcus sp. 4G2_DIV0659]OTO08941.1 hypothetical protein A5880_001941 [Enterococcus sp. 4G2_DIV0659]
MKKINYQILLSLAIFSISAFAFAPTAIGESNVSGNGTINFEGEYAQEVRDPEHPETILNPGDSPKTSGDLRIDFVPQFNFGSNKISDKDEKYYGNAQLFHDKTGARGNFIQISDYRGTGSGWILQVRQETQFRNDTTTNKELNGAVISLDQSWANSTRSEMEAPIVSKDVIRINNIGETYNLAEASQGKGQGTWSINFGASIENDKGRKDTLSPKMDTHGKPMLDPAFENKPIYQNEALTLSIPGATKKDPVNYQTVITWILSELP